MRYTVDINTQPEASPQKQTGFGSFASAFVAICVVAAVLMVVAYILTVIVSLALVATIVVAFMDSRKDRILIRSYVKLLRRERKRRESVHDRASDDADLLAIGSAIRNVSKPLASELRRNLHVLERHRCKLIDSATDEIDEELLANSKAENAVRSLLEHVEGHLKEGAGSKEEAVAVAPETPASNRKRDLTGVLWSSMVNLRKGRLLEDGKSVCDVDESGYSRLHFAKSPLAAEELLLKGADVNLQSRDEHGHGHTPLTLAILTGKLEVTRVLLAYGADVDLPDGQDTTPLHAAAYNGDAGMIRLLISHGADVNPTTSELLVSPLELAAVNGSRESVEVLLSNGAAVAESFVHAASRGHYDLVDRLAEGLDPEDNVSLAVVRGELEMVLDALAKTTDEKEHRVELNRLLRVACVVGQDQVARGLLDRGADPNGPSEEGGTPLLLASTTVYSSMVGLLLEHGADVHAKDSDGNTALHMAVAVFGTCGMETVQQLLQHGDSPNDRNSHGNSPLHLAVRKGSTELVRTLLAHGADASIENGREETPLSLAKNRAMRRLLK